MVNGAIAVAGFAIVAVVALAACTRSSPPRAHGGIVDVGYSGVKTFGKDGKLVARAARPIFRR
jgi:hypothetical protein